MVSTTPRSVRVQYLDPVNGKDLAAAAVFQQKTVLILFADGSQALLPYDGCVLQVGGANGSTPILVMLAGYNHFVRLYVLDRHIAERLDPYMPVELRKKLSRMTAFGWLRAMRVLPVVGLLLGLAASLWFGATWGFSFLVAQIPRSADVAVGKQMIGSFTADKTVDDRVVVAPIQQITARLLAQLPPDQPYAFRVQVIRSADENAFALPGGPILITTALIGASQDPDEIAGILGHEMQHVLGRHTFYRIARELGMNVALGLILGDSSVLTAIAYQAKDLVGLSYDRAQEAESDRIGMQIANKAGYRPQALGQFFERLQQKSHSSPNQEKLLSYVATHPAHGDRLAQIQAQMVNLPPPGPKAPPPVTAWPDVKRRAQAASKEPAASH